MARVGFFAQNDHMPCEIESIPFLLFSDLAVDYTGGDQSEQHLKYDARDSSCDDGSQDRHSALTR